jgi:hypothetical protein
MAYLAEGLAENGQNIDSNVSIQQAFLTLRRCCGLRPMDRLSRLSYSSWLEIIGKVCQRVRAHAYAVDIISFAWVLIVMTQGEVSLGILFTKVVFIEIVLNSRNE